MRTPPSLLELSCCRVFDSIDTYDLRELGRTLAPLRRPRKLMLMLLLRQVDDPNCKHGPGVNCVDRNWALLAGLLRSQSIKSFYLQKFYRWDKICGHSLSTSQFQAFVRSLPSNTPKLKRLDLIPTNTERYPYLFVDQSAVTSIVKLVGLRVLAIKEIFIAMSGFLEILQQCKYLSAVTASNIIPDVVPCSDSINNAFAMQFIKDERHKPGYGPISWSLGKYASVNRREFIKLTIGLLSVAKLNWARKLKHITRIKVVCYSLKADLEWVPHFPRLKVAKIYCCDTSKLVVKTFLAINGHTLDTLAVYHLCLDAKVTLEDIYNWCPNLEVLILSGSTLYTNNDAPSLPIMQRLHRFHWHDTSRQTMVPLSGILSAPLLKSVSIEAYEFDLSDRIQIIDRIGRREILQHLETFEIVRLKKVSNRKKRKLRELLCALESCIRQ